MASRTQYLKESVKCPICLELLTSPRALVCLHTFCENCIQGLVDGITSSCPTIRGIPCPVCREETPGPGRNIPHSDWAKHLRKNTTILPLIESINAVSTATSTERGIAAGVGTEPRSLTAGSRVITVDRSVTKTCAKHPPLLVEYYCRNHMGTLCKQCRALHRNCTDIVILSNEEMKSSIEWSRQDIESTFKNTLDKIRSITEALQVNITNTQTEIDHFPVRVRELQTIFNKTIDNLCETLEETADQSKNEHTKLQTCQIASCRSLENGIQTYKSELDYILRNRSLFQQFMACESVKSQLPDYESAVVAARKSMQYCKVRLSAVQVLESVIRLQAELCAIENKTFKPDFVD